MERKAVSNRLLSGSAGRRVTEMSVRVFLGLKIQVGLITSICSLACYVSEVNSMIQNSTLN